MSFDLRFDYFSAKIKLPGITAAYNHILCLSFPVTSFVYRFLFLLHVKWVRLPALYISVKFLALYKPHKITASVLAGQLCWRLPSDIEKNPSEKLAEFLVWMLLKISQTVPCCSHLSFHIKSLSCKLCIQTEILLQEHTDVFSRRSLISATVLPKSLYQTEYLFNKIKYFTFGFLFIFLQKSAFQLQKDFNSFVKLDSSEEIEVQLM